EALRAREILLQQPVAAERAPVVGQQRVAVPEAAFVDVAAIAIDRTHALVARAADEEALCVAQQLFVQALGQLVRAGDEDRQPVQGEGFHLRAGAHRELQPDARAHLAVVRALDARRGQRRRRPEVGGLYPRDRSPRHRTRGALAARAAL